MKLELLSLVLILAACAAATYSQQTKDEAAVRTLVEKLVSAQAAFDAAELDKLLAPDYIEISPAGEFDPRSEVVSFYGGESRARSAGVKVSIDENFRSVRVFGDTAIVIAELTYNIDQNGTVLPPRKMMMTAVCMKTRGVWKLASAHYTAMRPPPPVTKPQ